jgi:hypothetical protein
MRRTTTSFVFILSTLLGTAAVHAEGNWHQWRGPNRDGISTEKGLMSKWPEQGPKVVFQSKGLGAGMASLAIADG